MNIFRTTDLEVAGIKGSQSQGLNFSFDDSTCHVSKSAVVRPALSRETGFPVTNWARLEVVTLSLLWASPLCYALGLFDFIVLVGIYFWGIFLVGKKRPEKH